MIKINYYNKVNEIDVLSAFGNIEIINSCFIPRKLVAQHLNTSLYQVNKHCKNLIENGLLRKNYVEPYHDIEYETGIDYGNSLRICVTEITDKGIDKLKELNLYNDRWYQGLIDGLAGKVENDRTSIATN